MSDTPKNLTPNQLAILQHALGVDQYGRGQEDEEIPVP
jgi:hypothetical protein